jgi:hypothetical protein
MGDPGVSATFGSKNSIKSREQSRDAKKSAKHLPMPKQWRNSAAQKDHVKYSKENWQKLGRTGQEKWIQDHCSTKAHSHLSLCYPQQFPPGLPEAWDTLPENGTVIVFIALSVIPKLFKHLAWLFSW